MSIIIPIKEVSNASVIVRSKTFGTHLKTARECVEQGRTLETAEGAVLATLLERLSDPAVVENLKARLTAKTENVLDQSAYSSCDSSTRRLALATLMPELAAELGSVGYTAGDNDMFELPFIDLALFAVVVTGGDPTDPYVQSNWEQFVSFNRVRMLAELHAA